MTRIIRALLKWTIRVFLVVLGIAFIWGFIAYWTSTNDCGRAIPDGAARMKAIQYCEYGPPSAVLKLEQVEKPVPNENQILVRVRAVSLRFYDGGMLQGGVGRLVFGLRKPKNTIPGSDFAGTVESVGRNVTEFKPGEEVFGVRAGCLAQYVCVRRNGAIVSKPSNLSFEQAASVPTALVALQGLRDTGHVKAGDKVLINGASGGVGTFAVQIAKTLGAEVTGVCSTGNVDLVKSLGADRVIDYTKEDYTNGSERYDVIYDLVNNHSFAERQRVLKPGGICVLAGVGGAGMHEETLSRVMGVFTAFVRSRFAKEKFVSFGVKFDTKDLTILGDLAANGKAQPAVTKTYPLTEAAAAYKYLQTGHARGKIVITVE